MADESLVVSAPATSANLGPGFDALAVALDLSNAVVIRRRPGPLVVRVTGEGEGSLPADDGNLVCAAMRKGLDSLDGLEIECRNRIPLGRGLGSSAATVCAGLVAANALGGLRWSPRDILALATEFEGHADNAAACLEGGMITVTTQPVARRMMIHPDLAFIAVIPEAAVSTDQARQALPDTVPLADAAANIGLATGLVYTITQGRLDELSPYLDDHLHQPHRAAQVPGFEALRAAADGARILGVTISGSGPTSLVWCHADTLKESLTTIQELLEREGIVARARPSRVNPIGVRARWTSADSARLERSIG